MFRRDSWGEAIFVSTYVLGVWEIGKALSYVIRSHFSIEILRWGLALAGA